MNYFSDSKEWSYLFKNAIDWDKILPLYYKSFPTDEGFKNKEELLKFFEELLTSTGDWAANSVYEIGKELDKKGAGRAIDGSVEISEELKKLYAEAKNLEVLGLAVDKKYGGLGIPPIVSMIAFTQLNRACMSSATQLGFFTMIADMIERFCDEETKNKFIPMIVQGEISGSMCLTEPGAGSDVGSLRTSATKNADGTYSLNGSKMFITNGGGGLGFVLARIKGAPDGLEGISLFFVEEWIHVGGEKKKNYKIAKLEEKLGLHGSMTCEVVYENTTAKLVGREHDGFKIMLHLMNEARLAVGMQTLGAIENCLHYLRQYAESRTQFKKPLTELPLYKRNLTDYEIERDAFRALIIDTMSHYEIYQHYHMREQHEINLNEEETRDFKKASSIVRKRTPLVKAYGAETLTLFTQRVIQGLGGYGFMKEYEAERFHRDSFGPLLYEGTTQIQSLMAMKDLMKNIFKNPKKYFADLIYPKTLAKMTMARNEYEKVMIEVQHDFKKNLAKLLLHSLKPQIDKDHGIENLFKLKAWQDEKGIERLMIHAETLLSALSYLETLDVLSCHASKDKERATLFYDYHKLVIPRLEFIYADWKVRV
jgi:alkylation response protein AidB-like acyl-CoA dehydrogenase